MTPLYLTPLQVVTLWLDAQKGECRGRIGPSGFERPPENKHREPDRMTAATMLVERWISKDPANAALAPFLALWPAEVTANPAAGPWGVSSGVQAASQSFAAWYEALGIWRIPVAFFRTPEPPLIYDPDRETITLTEAQARLEREGLKVSGQALRYGAKEQLFPAWRDGSRWLTTVENVRKWARSENRGRPKKTRVA